MEYVTIEKEISIEVNSYKYLNQQIENASVSNGFDPVFKEYYWNNGNVKTLSILYNKPILDLLKSYWNK